MTTIIIIQALTCIVLFITVLKLICKNKNLLETVGVYKGKESYRESETPLYNLYIDKELILKDCISWSLSDLDTGRKLSVKAKDSFMTCYTHGIEIQFVKTEKHTYKVDQSVKETT